MDVKRLFVVDLIEGREGGKFCGVFRAYLGKFKPTIVSTILDC